MAEKVFWVKIKPNSKNEEISVENDTIIAKVNAPPVDGKANERLRELLSDFFKCPKSKISILAGKTSRTKKILIKE